jgi:Restriction Enzyme Adenine Methylase Associated
VRGKTFVRCDKALPSYLVLIPLMYLRFKFPEAWDGAADIDQYLLRSSLAGAFSGTPDQLIDDLVKEINRSEKFELREVFGVIRSQNRSLELTEDRLWSMGYGSDTIHLLFNLWYRGFNYTPAYENNLPQIDQIFPQSVLRSVKTANPSTGRQNVMKYREADRNQLANCMLLRAEENGAGGKSDKPLDEWFVGARSSSEYLEMHLIPPDKALWKLDRYDEFIAERKKLIAEKFKSLLVSDNAGPRLAQPLATAGVQKNVAYLISTGALAENAALFLTYKGREFTGKARPNGIELADGSIHSPSAAAVRCYEQTGTTRPSENGWQVWKSADGRSLNNLFADCVGFDNLFPDEELSGPDVLRLL